MPIPVACQCGAKFAAQDRLAGKAVKCPKCGQPIQIPAATTPAPAQPAAVAPPPVDPGVGSILDEIGLEGSKTGVKCPSCSADMQPGAIICIGCGYNTKTGKKLASVSDADAERRREEAYAAQAAAAERKGGRAKASGGSYSGEDPSALTTTDWIICILCSGIGCIAGLVYTITGNPKGPRMLVVSIIADLAKSALYYFLGQMRQ